MSEPKTPYIGSKISLISKLDIRYEGILYSVNSIDSTIALSKVRSFGTEDRSAQLVPARDEVYEFIIFKATDIKDIVVCEPPKPSSGSAYDPAILSVSAVEPKEPSTASSNSPLKPQNPTFNQTLQQSSFPTNNQMSGGFGRSRRVNDSVTSDGNFRTHLKENIGNQENGNPSTGKFQRQNDQGRFQQQTYYNRNNNDYSNNEHRSTRGHNNAVGGNNLNRSQKNNRFHHNNNNNNNNNQEQNIQSQQHLRNNLKFDSDFDFERANEKFIEQLCAVTSDFLKTNIKGEENNEDLAINNDSSPNVTVETFYNKKTSFFDSISCEALEKNEGKNTRPDWKKERMTNQETFGHSAVRSLAYRRGSRGGFTNNSGQNRSNFQHQQHNYNVNNFHRNNYRHNQQQSHQRLNYNRSGGRHQSSNFGNGNYNNQRQGGNGYGYHSQNRRQFQQNSEH